MNFLQKETTQNVLIVLMALFVIFDVRVPMPVADFVDTMVGKVAVVLTVLILLAMNPLVGSLAILAGMILVIRSSVTSGSFFVENQLPSQKKRDAELVALNETTKTLEEEVVDKMIPLASGEYVTTGYIKPVLSNVHEAAKL